MATTLPSELRIGPPWNDGPMAASCWMPAADTSPTKPWLAEPPSDPRADRAKIRSPTEVGGLLEAKSSLGVLPLGRMISARSRSSCQVHTDTFTSAPVPWRTKTSGPGRRVAARTVVNDVMRNVWVWSDATANAVPTDGWPASSRVWTKNSDGPAF